MLIVSCQGQSIRSLLFPFPINNFNEHQEQVLSTDTNTVSVTFQPQQLSQQLISLVDNKDTFFFLHPARQPLVNRSRLQGRPLSDI